MSTIATTNSTDQTKHTVSLIKNLTSLDNNLLQLIHRFQTLQNTLEDLEETLMISKKLADKLGELQILLLITEKALQALSSVPIVGPVIKIAQKVVAQLKNIVKQAKKRVDSLERKIKPHREKLAKFRKHIEKIVRNLTKVDGFVKKDKQLMTVAHTMTSALPESRYKIVSQKRLNFASNLQNKILIIPNEILVQVNKLLSATDSIIEVIEKLCHIINQVFKPIIILMDELDRILLGVKDINNILQKKITINLLIKKITLTVKEIIMIYLTNPLFYAAKVMIEKMLNTVLKKMGMGVDSIPGLGQSVGSLGKVFGKLNEMEKLKKEMINALNLLTGDKNPQKTFKQVDAGKL